MAKSKVSLRYLRAPLDGTRADSKSSNADFSSSSVHLRSMVLFNEPSSVHPVSERCRVDFD